MKSFKEWMISEGKGWYVTGFSLMPYLKVGGPAERIPAANSLEEFLEKIWAVNRGRPYFPKFIASPEGQQWKLPQQAAQNMVAQIQEFSGGPAYFDDPSSFTSDEIDPLKKIYDRYMALLEPTQ